MSERSRYRALEEGLGHQFGDRELLKTALTHSSAAHEEETVSYERLEFLGDSVVGLVTAQWLFEQLPHSSEGGLARLKSYLVSDKVLARLAERLELGLFLRLGSGEEKAGGRNRRSLLAEGLESVVGALYLDGGLEPVSRLLRPWLEQIHRDHPELEDQDAKTRLQEFLQARGRGLPDYRVVDTTGPEHERLFHIACFSQCRRLSSGLGRSKKRAEQEAARRALLLLENEAPLA